MFKLISIFSFFVFIFPSLFAAKAESPKEQIPLWIQDPSFIYSTDEYVSNLGQGRNQKEADTDALLGLAAFFNRSIASNTKASLDYSSEANEGNTKIEKSKRLKQDIKISTKMEELIGTEIRERWKSQDGTFYALAVIEKTNGARLYREKVLSYIDAIDKLLNAGNANKGTFTEYFKCLEASGRARTLQLYQGCLAVLDTSGQAIRGEREAGEYSPLALKIRAEKVAKSIEVFVDVPSEAKKLKPHIEKVFSKHSFTLSKKDSARYKLVVKLDLDDAKELSQGRLAMRYNFEIELLDTQENETVFPFAFEGKETHFDIGGVKNKIFKTLEKKAMEEFASSFARFATTEQ